MVGEIGDARPPVRDPVAEGPPALVRDLEREDGEGSDLCLARLHAVEGPRAGKTGGRYREVRWGHEPPEDALGVTLRGHVEINPGAGAVAAAKNGKPWVWSQCMWPSTIDPLYGWPSKRSGLPRKRSLASRIPVPASTIEARQLTVEGNG